MQLASPTRADVEVGRTLHAVQEVQVVGQHAGVKQCFGECAQGLHVVVDAPQQHVAFFVAEVVPQLCTRVEDEHGQPLPVAHYGAGHGPDPAGWICRRCRVGGWKDEQDAAVFGILPKGLSVRGDVVPGARLVAEADRKVGGRSPDLLKIGFAVASRIEVVKTDESFATAVCGLVDLESRVFRFTSAGGPPGLLIHENGSHESLESS